MAPGGSPTTSFASFLLGVLRTISRSRTRTRRCASDATHASRRASVSSEWPPLPRTRQKADVEPLGLTQPQPPERAAPAGRAPAPKPQAQRPLPRAGWARRRRGTPRPQPVPCSPHYPGPRRPARGPTVLLIRSSSPARSRGPRPSPRPRHQHVGLLPSEDPSSYPPRPGHVHFEGGRSQGPGAPNPTHVAPWE